MTTLETFTERPQEELARAEVMAAEVRHNLLDYLNGGRGSFEAHFPVGIGSKIQDEAHQKFVESLGQIEAGEGSIVLAGGHTLFVNELKYSEDEGGRPYHIIYSSEPFLNLDAEV